jgi:hypothetical protein
VAAALRVADGALIAVWIATSLTILVTFGAAAGSLRRRRRQWKARTVDGVPLLVSPDLGPAVVGATDARIVLPEWALELPPAERALMLAHEQEHLRARDPLLLHAAALAAVVMPWNLAVWAMLRRLRVAVEVDCDRRVLRAGGDPVRYGALLLDVAAQRSFSIPIVAPALLERRSSLAVRILAMQTRRPRFPRVHAALCATAAVALIMVACEAPTPEMLAPDGTDKAEVRVYGSATGNVADRSDRGMRELVERRFPEVLAGRVGPSMLIFVSDSAGTVLASERQAAPPNVEARQPAAEAPGATAAPEPSRRRRSARAAFDSSSLLNRLHSEMVQTVDVSKYKGGTFGPDPVSIIWITLKPGNALPVADAPR